MAVFEYNAVDLHSAPLAGTVVAGTPRQARDILRARSLTITSIRKNTPRSRIFNLRRQGRASQAETVSFIRELATLLTAGIALHTALNTLERQHKHHFKTVIQTLADQVASGSSLAEAMGSRSDYFDAYQ